MDTEERIKALEEEFEVTKEELKQILMDIRAFIMEVENPLKPFERRETSDQVIRKRG